MLCGCAKKRKKPVQEPDHKPGTTPILRRAAAHDDPPHSVSSTESKRRVFFADETSSGGGGGDSPDISGTCTSVAGSDESVWLRTDAQFGSVKLRQKSNSMANFLSGVGGPLDAPMVRPQRSVETCRRRVVPGVAVKDDSVDGGMLLWGGRSRVQGRPRREQVTHASLHVCAP